MPCWPCRVESSPTVKTLFALLLTGCGSVLQAPAAPAAIVPTIANLPSAPPLASQARLLLDVEGARARVFRVTDQGSITLVASHGAHTALVPAARESLEPLCLTPCAIDTAPGYYYLKFQSRDDPERIGYADAGLEGGKTTVVRHALGLRRPASGAFAAGAITMFAGIGASLFGLFLVPFGTLAQQPSASGAMSRVDGTAVIGTGIGMAIGGGGLAAFGAWWMSRGQPVEQPGATTTWTLE